MRDRTRTKKKSSKPIMVQRRQSAPCHEHVDVNSKFSWTPELFGPVFTNDKISLRQALQTHLTDRKTRMLATLVPDELIYALDLTKKNFREFIAVLLLVDMSAFNRLWEKFSCAENNGSYGFSSILSAYMSSMVENIYSSEGDIIKVSAEEVLAMWKVRKDEFIAKTIDAVIERALHMKNAMKDLGTGLKSLAKGRFSMAEATRRKLGTDLKTFVLDSVFQQIEKDCPLEYLTETRMVTVAIIHLKVINSSVYELVTLIDECYILLHSIVSDHVGCLNAPSIHDNAIQFFVVFGLRRSETRDDCKNGILSVARSIRALKCIPGIQGASVGISTGMVFCGVIGDSSRMNYVTFGSPIDKSKKIAYISSDKICCEFDSIFYSRFPREKFRSRGITELKGFGRDHLYEFIDDTIKYEKFENVANLDYVYPILGRFRELDIFTDVLDDICSSGRTYCGLLIEGRSRIGKSRLLDELARIVKSRQISVYKLCLDESNASKPYATIYHLLMQLLGIKDSRNVEERERALSRSLSSVVPWNDFCYLNIVTRVAFPLSANYRSESEETRVAKSLIIFDAIIRSLRGPNCIILDDVQFMDSISWQFISRSMNNSKLIVAMAMHRTVSPTEFPESKNFIARDKRIYRHILQRLEPGNMSALVCQLLNVHAISKKLDNIVKSRSYNDPGWCEAFVSLMLQNKSLKVRSVTPDEASHKDLIYPHPCLITKIPKDLSPEDATSEFPWIRGKGNVMVCLTTDKFTGDIDSILDINEIYREIYDQSTPYERDLLQCAATLGNVFMRNTLQTIMPNSTALDTARAVTRMIDMRILECALIQRRDLEINDSVPCMYKNRATFSDMHHLVQCTCKLSDGITGGDMDQYSHCRLLEFKCHGFKKFIDMQVALCQRNEYNSKVVEIYERDARKCSACGGGPFLRIPGREKPITVETTKILYSSPRMSSDEYSRVKPKRRSFLSISNEEFREHPGKMNVRRISIMPTYSDVEEGSTSSLDAGGMVACVERISGINEDKESVKFRKRTSTSVLLTENDASHISHLQKLNHIDYRNCQCNGIIDCLFGKLYQHLESIGHSERLVRFIIDYSAGLIKTGQSFQAMRLLTATYEKIESSSGDIRYMERKTEDSRINQGALLVLMGDASNNLGDLGKVKRYYSNAVRLRVNTSCNSSKVCVSYRIFEEACKQKLHQRYPDFFVNRLTGYDVATKLSAAVYLARLSTILSQVDRYSASKLAALESFNIGFACSGSFIVKCDIYIKIARIFLDLEDLSFAQSLEKPMIYTIRSKHWWSDAEEVTAVATVFKSMFEIRLLSGEYENALTMGTKVLKISAVLKMSRARLTILPQMIQLTIRTKRIHETVDLMTQLYHSAPEDIDESSITWYYALSLDLALDAGMILESFENCVEYAKKITGSKFGPCVSRDPDSLRRLLTCLWLWQLRMSIPPTFAQSLKYYTGGIRVDSFCHVLTVAKALECYLLTLTCCINMKRADQLVSLLNDIETVVNILEKISKTALFIKPRLYMLKAYLEMVRGCKLTAMRYMWKGSKLAMDQANPMMLAWIRQNERTWRVKQYNNMARYWVEHVGFNDTCNWQNMHCFDIKTWSSILFPIPIPDTCL